MLHRVLLKCQHRAKKQATWRFELSTFRGNRVNRASENLKLLMAFRYQAAYFYMLIVKFFSTINFSLGYQD